MLSASMDMQNGFALKMVSGRIEDRGTAVTSSRNYRKKKALFCFTFLRTGSMIMMKWDGCFPFGDVEKPN